MQRRPWYQRILISIGAFCGGVVAIGAILDALGNAVALIPPSVTYAGTVVVLTAVTCFNLALRRGVSWLVRGDIRVRLTAANASAHAFVLGILVVLWVPAILRLSERRAAVAKSIPGPTPTTRSAGATPTRDPNASSDAQPQGRPSQSVDEPGGHGGESTGRIAGELRLGSQPAKAPEPMQSQAREIVTRDGRDAEYVPYVPRARPSDEPLIRIESARLFQARASADVLLEIVAANGTADDAAFLSFAIEGRGEYPDGHCKNTQPAVWQRIELEWCQTTDTEHIEAWTSLGSREVAATLLFQPGTCSEAAYLHMRVPTQVDLPTDSRRRVVLELIAKCGGGDAARAQNLSGRAHFANPLLGRWRLLRVRLEANGLQVTPWQEIVRP